MSDRNTRVDRTSRPGRYVPAGPRAAFTMIEMLVVLLIMGIILAIGAGVATKVLKDSDKHETISRLKIVQSAIEAYYEEKKKWPASLNDLAGVERCKSFLVTLPEECMDASATSLKVRDSYGRDIVYQSSGGPGGAPRLTSHGPDGKSGGNDDIIAHEH